MINNIYVSHYVGLSGVGGVQRNFIEYLDYATKHDINIKHKVYTLGNVDKEYCPSNVKIKSIKSFFNFIIFIAEVISKNHIVHFYNNLTSAKVAFMLLFIPTKKVIFHERGSAWNLDKKKSFFVKIIVWKSSIVLVNSFATKTILVKKFLINDDKIVVMHNGINTKHKCIKKYTNLSLSSFFHVGLIGRLDTPKSVDVAIESMKYLTKEKIILSIAGDGVLMDFLTRQAKELKNIRFIGRISDPYNFISSLDMLIVPSIREPLGNVCLEAGLCYTPVLATNIDGIPEIIKHRYSGELIDPTQKIIKKNIKGELPIPDYVVNPKTQTLQKPLQIDPIKLAATIINWKDSPIKILKYSKNLHNIVINDFSISRYTRDLHKMYRLISNYN